MRFGHRGLLELTAIFTFHKTALWQHITARHMNNLWQVIDLCLEVGPPPPRVELLQTHASGCLLVEGFWTWVAHTQSIFIDIHFLICDRYLVTSGIQANLLIPSPVNTVLLYHLNLWFPFLISNAFPIMRFMNIKVFTLAFCGVFGC